MADRPPCRYLIRPAQVLEIDAKSEKRSGNVAMSSDARLCGWALESDAAATRMEGVPVWVQREAEAGFRWRPGDCERCPAHEAA